MNECRGQRKNIVQWSIQLRAYGQVEEKSDTKLRSGSVPFACMPPPSQEACHTYAPA